MSELCSAIINRGESVPGGTADYEPHPCATNEARGPFQVNDRWSRIETPVPCEHLRHPSLSSSVHAGPSDQSHPALPAPYFTLLDHLLAQECYKPTNQSGQVQNVQQSSSIVRDTSHPTTFKRQKKEWQWRYVLFDNACDARESEAAQALEEIMVERKQMAAPTTPIFQNRCGADDVLDGFELQPTSVEPNVNVAHPSKLAQTHPLNVLRYKRSRETAQKTRHRHKIEKRQESRNPFKQTSVYHAHFSKTFEENSNTGDSKGLASRSIDPLQTMKQQPSTSHSNQVPRSTTVKGLLAGNTNATDTATSNTSIAANTTSFDSATSTQSFTHTHDDDHMNDDVANTSTSSLEEAEEFEGDWKGIMDDLVMGDVISWAMRAGR